MKSSVDFESVLSLVDKAINPTYLNPTQEIVLREVWKGKTYTEMAYDYNYDPEYIKGVGCSLWRTLSLAFDRQINKSNFVPFIRQEVIQLDEESLLEDRERESLNSNSGVKQICHWTTAPQTKNFVGRESELNSLEGWSNEPDCRCIVVSGMVGCGKTTLATKFARKVRDRFDYVIWFSLLQTPSLKTLLNNYLNLIEPQALNSTELESLEISFLISKFVECLRKHKVLLIVDGLQCVMEVSKTNTSYRKEYEEYGQFLRSIISTNHQSLLIATSRVQLKSLEYYSKNQVKFLNLQGFNTKTTRSFLKRQNIAPALESKISFLARILQGNPQLLKISHSYLENFPENNDSEKQTLQDISLLEEIKNLLELELSYSSSLEREIIYWLATSCSSISHQDLIQDIEQSQRKLEFLQSLNCLVKRSLITKVGETYSLMPLMKVYLRRKLVKQALVNSHF